MGIRHRPVAHRSRRADRRSRAGIYRLVKGVHAGRRGRARPVGDVTRADRRGPGGSGPSGRSVVARRSALIGFFLLRAADHVRRQRSDRARRRVASLGAGDVGAARGRRDRARVRRLRRVLPGHVHPPTLAGPVIAVRATAAIPSTLRTGETRSCSSHTSDVGRSARRNRCRPSRRRPATPIRCWTAPGRSAARSSIGFASVPPPIALFAIVVVGYVGMVAVLVGVGEVLVHTGALAGLRDWDDHVTAWMADHRTGSLDTVTGFLSRAADTIGVVVCALVIELVLVVQRRWWALLIVPIGLGARAGHVPHRQRHRRSTPTGRGQARFGTEHVELPVRAHRRDGRGLGRRRRAVLRRRPRTDGCARPRSRSSSCWRSPSAPARVYRGMHHPTDVDGRSVDGRGGAVA